MGPSQSFFFWCLGAGDPDLFPFLLYLLFDLLGPLTPISMSMSSSYKCARTEVPQSLPFPLFFLYFEGLKLTRRSAPEERKSCS